MLEGESGHRLVNNHIMRPENVFIVRRSETFKVQETSFTSLAFKTTSYNLNDKREAFTNF